MVRHFWGWGAQIHCGGNVIKTSYIVVRDEHLCKVWLLFLYVSTSSVSASRMMVAILNKNLQKFWNNFILSVYQSEPNSAKPTHVATGMQAAAKMAPVKQWKCWSVQDGAKYTYPVIVQDTRSGNNTT